MKRILAFAYGVVCYVLFLVTLAYAVGFLGNFGVPKSIDSAPDGSFPVALFIDAALLCLFALQHSIMARSEFKRVWISFVPGAVERSTYVLFSCLALLLVFWQWRPIGGIIWKVESRFLELVVLGLYAAGLLIVLVSTFLLNHFDLYGLRQVYLYLTGRRYFQLRFRTPFFYRYVRHPLYFGWLLTFWSARVMTVAHLFFALVATAYVLVAIRFEEKDMIALHGTKYRRYRRQVPMLLPSPGAGRESEKSAA